MLVEGAITGTLFQSFLATMPPRLQGNTLILDNAAIHHASKSLSAQNLPTIAETARAKNIQLAYIPPYSPQCNPTELFFASLKKRVNKVSSMTAARLQKTIESTLETQKWNIDAMFRHCFAWLT
jgi:transposase